MDSISKATLDNVTVREEAEIRAANIKLALDDLFDTKLKKNARVLSTIASSSTTSDYPSIIRESKSLDPFPSDYRQTQLRWKEPKKSFRSLENCEKCESSKENLKILNNNYPNGNVIKDFTEEEPLLEDTSTSEENKVKRWRSLDQVARDGANGVPDKKSSARNSIRSWLVNLFNANGVRSSEVSIRRGVIAGYDIQGERESIV